jgi:hypothetical protein
MSFGLKKEPARGLSITPLIDNPYNYETELVGQELIRWRFVAIPFNSR